MKVDLVTANWRKSSQFTAHEWRAFLAGVRDGEFDSP